ISHKHGLTTWLENYGHWGFPGEFLQYGGQSDEISGEFWSEGDLGDIENRAASSSAHIYGKTKVSAESFTSAGGAYGRHPAAIKRRGDWSFTEGVNSTLMHVYIQQAYEDLHPGVNAWFGTEFNRKNTWFGHMDLFTAYLKRCNFMLQQGLNVADVAYFIGEDAPKMTGIRNPEIPAGYSYDYINAEVIVRDLFVKDGKLMLPHGTSYRVLVLPALETMRPEVLTKIEQLVAEGATVLGPPPSRSPSMKGYPEADKQVKSLAEKLWGDLSVKQRSYGKGTLLTGMSMQEVLDLLKTIPDCRIEKGIPVRYAHRTLDGKDIYFVANQSEQRVETSIGFRVKNMQPELWNAVTGEVRHLPSFDQTGEVATIPIRLEPLESAFLVFRKKGRPAGASAQLAANFPDMKILTVVNSPWEVTFESDAIKRGPSETVIFDKLTDWTQSENEQIRYYSGTAIYKTTLTVDKKLTNEKLYLDLGKVNMMAKVKINNKYVGGVWTMPYRLDVTSQLKNGENSIEIALVNTWVNRIIGDLRLPPEKRILSMSNITWQANSPLQPSGLLGPVSIVKM
ncbi:MAG: glycoside hydrolase family 2, partial [Prevotellaceae bacterium]|nr:glycoside hydrolase family 2 [Prevotellaceae bacterium]